MNPSSSGWIKKLLKIASTNDAYLKLSEKAFYNELKLSGFIYGSNLSVVNNVVDKGDLTDEELCKVNLLLALHYIYNAKPSKDSFADSVINFYKNFDQPKSSFFDGLLGEKKSHAQVEVIINKRIHIDDNILTKNFSYFITNALLYIDVLAYQKFLITNTISEKYIQQLEIAIETITLNVFDSKVKKTKYDESLIKLFEASRRYQSTVSYHYNDVLKYLKKPLEKQYIIDIACIASWSDKIIDIDEHKFLVQLSKDLHIKPEVVEQSIKDINTFYILNSDQIPLLSSKNMAKSFYDNSSKMVSKLISRNSKRLMKELRESKELMVLLSQSTSRELTEEEQKKMQEQLMDIIKSIPSLAIFMLPGGGILLPLFVKFIPKLLPSAFDENRIEE
ncbi:LETM1-related biofilm-associated protein [Aquaticitalea lipolytica]|jgi:hypothetical protein|uniref:LETM1-related biofilm-associated protein n=1 Tax=Aquaticitalea lipolytica TaxID=1247562 RepID=UPI0024B975E8|nr:LETM1-related biofilm-associated protein [Aquaticitalea lipolytica]